MATAVAWAYCGVKIAPSLTASHGARVYSFKLEEGKVTAPALAGSTPLVGLTPSTAELEELFSNSVHVQQTLVGSDAIGTVRGRPAKIDPSSITVLQDRDGVVSLSAMLRSSDNSVNVTYSSHKVSPVWMFTPKSAHYDASDREIAARPSDSLQQISREDESWGHWSTSRQNHLLTVEQY